MFYWAPGKLKLYFELVIVVSVIMNQLCVVFSHHITSGEQLCTFA